MTFPIFSMYSTTITLRPNGSMTLPKKLRDEFTTIHFMAMKVDGGVMLRPIREEIEYYEKSDGTVGLHFPYGIEAGRLAKMMRVAIDELDQEKGWKKKASSKKRASRG